jgi:hypothetical protein
MLSPVGDWQKHSGAFKVDAPILEAHLVLPVYVTCLAGMVHVIELHGPLANAKPVHLVMAGAPTGVVVLDRVVLWQLALTLTLG